MLIGSSPPQDLLETYPMKVYSLWNGWVVEITWAWTRFLWGMGWDRWGGFPYGCLNLGWGACILYRERRRDRR